MGTDFSDSLLKALGLGLVSFFFWWLKRRVESGQVGQKRLKDAPGTAALTPASPPADPIRPSTAVTTITSTADGAFRFDLERSGKPNVLLLLLGLIAVAYSLFIIGTMFWFVMSATQLSERLVSLGWGLIILCFFGPLAYWFGLGAYYSLVNSFGTLKATVDLSGISVEGRWRRAHIVKKFSRNVIEAITAEGGMVIIKTRKHPRAFVFDDLASNEALWLTLNLQKALARTKPTRPIGVIEDIS